MLEEVKCDLCGRSHYKVLYRSGCAVEENQTYRISQTFLKAPYQIVKCLGCGLVYASPRAKIEKILSSYADMVDEEYAEEEPGRRLSARVILSRIESFKKGGKILDVGCATGFLLDEAKKRGWDAHGVELSKWCACYAKDKLGLNVVCGMLKDAGFNGSFFDAVVLQDTIEHLIDPKETLIQIRRILKPDGILYVNTPDINSMISRVLRTRWWGINQSHLYYFSKKTLYKMLEAAGFVPLQRRRYARTFSFRYWVRRFENYDRRIYKALKFLCDRTFLKNKLFRINTADQIEVYAKKSRSIEYLHELEHEPDVSTEKQMKTIAVLPAYNAETTLKKTVSDIPRDVVDEIILVDDKSSDRTVKVAKELGLKVFEHKINKGYGGNQKTCYKKALESGADIIVMVHPDYQYDPKAIPDLIGPIRSGKADAVFGSRMMKGGALIGGMPLWKHNTNIILTAAENVIFGTYLTEYHSGFRAYSADVLRSINFMKNSDGFIFDTEIIAQILLKYFRIEEVPIKTRYFDEASVIKLWPGICYGLGIIKT
ncbi:MAG: methyltransferase domain-containing protein, partial [Candidatus Omnitrophota bacterium]